VNFDVEGEKIEKRSVEEVVKCTSGRQHKRSESNLNYLYVICIRILLLNFHPLYLLKAMNLMFAQHIKMQIGIFKVWLDKEFTEYKQKKQVVICGPFQKENMDLL
jgi:hypothetical protein